MKNSPAWILQVDSRKGFPHPDFSSHKSRPVCQEEMHQRPQTAILVMQKQVKAVTLEFGGNPNKRVLPGCLEKQGALVLNTPVLTGSLTHFEVVPF